MAKSGLPDLLAWGFAPVGVGGVTLSGPAHLLARAWERCLDRRFGRRAFFHLHPSPLISETALRRAKTFHYFPHQLMLVRPRRDSRAPHFMAPAACYHGYAHLSGRWLGSRPLTFSLCAVCARAETGRLRLPFRLQVFRMYELVTVGTAATVQRWRGRFRQRMLRLFHDAGLSGEFTVSSDAFFLGGGAGARLIQQLKSLKEEFRAPTGRTAVALASLNYHEDFFGRSFGIRAAGVPAHSSCAAFGIERLTAYGLLQWGPRSRQWPTMLRP